MNLAKKKLSYTMLDEQQNQLLSIELERSTQLLNSSTQECTRLKQELSRYKALHEDTNQKTSYMKDSINQLVGEIEKLNDLILLQDERILMDRYSFESTAKQLTEQKQEKVQLLDILHSFQSVQKTVGTQEVVQQFEKEISGIKINYDQLIDMHNTEIGKLRDELTYEKERFKQFEFEFMQNQQKLIDTRLEEATETLERQLLQMGQLLAQKQAEIDNNLPQLDQIEELQGQVQHFKDLLAKTQLEFNLYRQSGKKEQPASEQQVQVLLKQLFYLEDQNSLLRASQDDQQVQVLLKDLALLRQENLKLKEKPLNNLQQNIELCAQLKRLQERELELEQQVKANHISDERLANLLSVVQSLQAKNEQLQLYLNSTEQQMPRANSPFKVPIQMLKQVQNQVQNSVTVRKQPNPTMTQNYPQQHVYQHSPVRQLFHRSNNPSINQISHQFLDLQQ